MNRRGLFRLIAAAFVAPQLPKAAAVTKVAVPAVAPSALDFPALFHHSARLLGVLAPGEALTAPELEQWSIEYLLLIREGRYWRSDSQFANELAARMSAFYCPPVSIYCPEK